MKMGWNERSALFAEIQPNDGTRYQILLTNRGGDIEVHIGAGDYLQGGSYVNRYQAKRAIEFALCVANNENVSDRLRSELNMMRNHFSQRSGVDHAHTAMVALLAAAVAYWGDVRHDLCDVVEEYYRRDVHNGSIQRIIEQEHMVSKVGAEDVF